MRTCVPVSVVCVRTCVRVGGCMRVNVCVCLLLRARVSMGICLYVRVCVRS